MLKNLLAIVFLEGTLLLNNDNPAYPKQEFRGVTYGQLQRPSLKWMNWAWIGATKKESCWIV